MSEPIFSVLTGKGCPEGCWPVWQYGDDSYGGGPDLQTCIDTFGASAETEEYCTRCATFDPDRFPNSSGFGYCD